MVLISSQILFSENFSSLLKKKKKKKIDPHSSKNKNYVYDIASKFAGGDGNLQHVSDSPFCKKHLNSL